MNPIYQTIFTVPGGNCLQACLASILNLPLESVPHFANIENDDWWIQCQDWCRQFGIYPIYIPADGVKDPYFLKGYHLITGETSAGHSHVVVGCDGKVVHNPIPEGTGLAKITGYILFVSTMGKVLS